LQEDFGILHQQPRLQRYQDAIPEREKGVRAVLSSWQRSQESPKEEGTQEGIHLQEEALQRRRPHRRRRSQRHGRRRRRHLRHEAFLAF